MHILRSAHARGELDPQRLPHDGSACNYQGKFCDGLAWCGFREAPGGPALADFRRRLPIIQEGERESMRVNVYSQELSSEVKLIKNPQPATPAWVANDEVLNERN
jgi:hypothetical protein